MASRYGLLAGLALAFTFFWDAVVLRPVKLLVVLVHEMWHGLSALAFGLQLDQIKLGWDESGETLVSGEISTAAFIVTVLLGYPGTTFTGALLLRRGLMGNYERLVAGLFAFLLFYMSYLFTGLADTGFLIGSAWSIIIGLTTLHERAARITLVASGVFFIFYSLFDLFDFHRNLLGTDAGILANYLVSRNYSSMSVQSIATITSFALSGLIVSMLYVILKPAILHSFAIEHANEVSVPESEPVFAEEPLDTTEPGVSDFSEAGSELEQTPSDNENPVETIQQIPENEDRFYEFLVDPENAARKLTK